MPQREASVAGLEGLIPGQNGETRIGRATVGNRQLCPEVSGPKGLFQVLGSIWLPNGRGWWRPPMLRHQLKTWRTSLLK